MNAIFTANIIMMLPTTVQNNTKARSAQHRYMTEEIDKQHD